MNCLDWQECDDWNIINNKVGNQFLRLMRPRSRGISCHSFDELLESCSSQSTANIRPYRQDYPEFIDIQSYLQSQQHNNNFTQDHQYFFFQADQLRAEEEQELNIAHPIKFIQNSIALLCPNLKHILTVLTNPHFINSLPQHPGKLNQETIPLSELKSGFSLICPATYCSLTHATPALQGLVVQTSEFGSEVFLKSLEGSSSEIEDNMPLQLVIYNNIVQSHSQIFQGKKDSRSSRCIYQYKIWLIQQQQQYSQLQTIYINKLRFLFTASASNGQVYLKKTTVEQVINNKPGNEDAIAFGSQLQQIEQYLRN